MSVDTSNKTTVVKRDNELVKYDRQKLINSLERSGAGEELINEVVSSVEANLYNNITTREIYKSAFSLLRKKSKSNAARYKLKRAILELGPTGYPFERFVGELLRHQGYNVRVGVFVEGNCVMHEVDVIAESDSKHFMVECKFHSDFNRKCAVQVPLYIQSRFLDIREKWKTLPGHHGKLHQGWVVTNTRFSEDAIRYGQCVGLNMVSWNFPKKGSLKERIDTSGLHPITCLNSLTKKEKGMLLNRDIVLCSKLPENMTALEEIVRIPRKIKAVLEEVDLLLQ